MSAAEDAEYQGGYDPAFATVPQKADHPDELSLCHAMQVWAVQEVDPRNNQRAICINDWFAEEFLILSTRTSLSNGSDKPEFKQKDNPNG